MKCRLISLTALLFSTSLMAAETAPAPKPAATPTPAPALAPTAVPSNYADEDRYEAETIQTRFFKGHSLDVGGFGGLTTKYSRIMGLNTSVVGLRGALLLNHNVFIGAGGYGVAGDLKVPNDPLKQTLSMGYAVGMVGYSFAPHRLVHLNLVGNFGGGGAVLTKPDPNKDKDKEDDEDTPNLSRTDLITVVEPEVLVEINVTSYLRVDIGCGYRYVGGLKLDPITPAQLRGWTPTISIIGGKF